MTYSKKTFGSIYFIGNYFKNDADHLISIAKLFDINLIAVEANQHVFHKKISEKCFSIYSVGKISREQLEEIHERSLNNSKKISLDFGSEK